MALYQPIFTSRRLCLKGSESVKRRILIGIDNYITPEIIPE
jgi:hypothetical protein